MDVVSEKPRILLSIVSHGHADLVGSLLADIDRYCRELDITVVLTENIAETFIFNTTRFSFPLKRIKNKRPLGFGANHNQAFASTTSDYFCIVNPDISLRNDPMTALLDAMEDPLVVIAAPLIYGPDGELQDSVRKKITPARIVSRMVSPAQRKPDYSVESGEIMDIDWAAGMFLLVRSEAFHGRGGFDERYFMYCEDADLCERLRQGGGRVCLVPQAKVIHDARRSSHRNARHLRWHVLSLLRFFSAHLLPSRRQR